MFLHGDIHAYNIRLCNYLKHYAKNKIQYLIKDKNLVCLEIHIYVATLYKY